MKRGDEAGLCCDSGIGDCRRPHLQEGDVILTGSLRLQRGSPLCQLAKLLLQAVHHPVPLCHHSIQLGHDPAHHMRPDLVQRAGQVVQQVFNLAALSVSMALKHRRVQMFGEKRATTPSSSTGSTRPARFLHKEQTGESPAGCPASSSAPSHGSPSP